jgi:hypothetical protein
MSHHRDRHASRRPVPEAHDALRQLGVPDLEPLRNAPALRAVNLRFGSVRKNDAGQAFLGLPRVSAPDDWRED